MNTDRIQQRLGIEASKKSVNTDTYLKIDIEGKQRLLPPDEINEVVNINERFDTERQRSPYYRILGTINPIFTNALFNLNDTVKLDLYTWSGFNYKDQVKNEYRFYDPIYPNVLNKYLKEKDGWFGYFDPDIRKSGFCNFYDMEPKRERFSFIPDATSSTPVKNWELTITYPYNIDSGHTMVNNGLMIIEAVPAVVSTREMTAFGMPCLHNLVIGDIVRITGTTGYDGDHEVVRTGLDNGDLMPYYFVIDLPPTGQTSSNPINLSRMKKIVDGVESTYYFRKFKKIKTRNTAAIETDDYETYKLAFSENAYNDSITQFVFNEDIDIGDLKDNLGRPLNELYLTMVKTDSNGLFCRVSSGIETPFIADLNTSSINTVLLEIPAINKIHNGFGVPFTSHVPLELNINISGGTVNSNDFYGDLVEYNVIDFKETILAEVSHRFNTLNREISGTSMTYILNPANDATQQSATTNTVFLGPRQEGYFYKAHHLIKIRQFSTYVEQGDEFTVGIPDYAVDLGDGRYLWRDILDIGFNQTDAKALDYPFVNGCHYMYDNYCFSVRRQDPFNNWDLYHYKFPADPIGQRITDKFITNSAEDVC